MSSSASFKGYTIVSCGTLNHELNFLRKSGFLDVDKILYTTPGLHENLKELEKQLIRQLHNARKYSEKIIVVYGSRCYLDIDHPERDIDRIIKEQDGKISRIQAANCTDILIAPEEKERISQGVKVYWLPTGWFLYQKYVFKDWDVGKANETFPQHDKAILLDSLGIFDKYSQNSPERILEFSDWMKIPIEPYQVSLDRLKNLLMQAQI